jgi:hypothetical protein
MAEQEKKYHPAPLSHDGLQKMHAYLKTLPPEKTSIAVTYLVDVTAPDFKVGEKGQTKEVERHWAEQLMADGYCVPAGSAAPAGSLT